MDRKFGMQTYCGRPLRLSLGICAILGVLPSGCAVDDGAEAVGSAAQAVDRTGWTSTSSVSSHFSFCGATQQLRPGLHHQICLGDSANRLASLEDWQSYDVFTATSGSHFVQVQDSFLNDCQMSTTSTQTCSTSARVNNNPASCGTRSLPAVGSITCVSKVSSIIRLTGPAWRRLSSDARVGIDGQVFLTASGFSLPIDRE